MLVPLLQLSFLSFVFIQIGPVVGYEVSNVVYAIVMVIHYATVIASYVCGCDLEQRIRTLEKKVRELE